MNHIGNISADNCIVLQTIEAYERTESGKAWKKKPKTVERYVIPSQYYINFTHPDALIFFNCRTTKSYTVAGHIVTMITRVNPYNNIRIVEKFDILYKPDLLHDSGFRERDIIERATTFELDEKADVIHFYTDWDKTGHRDGCEWSLIRRAWIG